MALDQHLLYGSVGSTLPTSQNDGTNINSRYSNYGEAYVLPVMPWRHALAREGSYFTFFDATLDLATTVAGHAAPVLADIDATLVKATLFLRNESTNTSKKFHLDWIKIHVKTAGANGTSALWAMQIGTTTRYTSGGTDLTVSNPNTESSATLTSVLTAKAGPIVIAAENATSRRIGHGVLRDGIEVAGDSKLFVFGGDPIQSTVEAASGTFDAINAPPVVLGSGGEFMLGLAGVAQSVAGVYGVSGGGYWR